jgi:transposase-like protein
MPGAEVSDKPTRRRFTAEYKERILELADGCKTPGSVGALLRKEGLYSSTLTLWRRQRKEGGLTALDGKKRGRKGPDPVVVENQQLVKENQGLKEDLRKAELIIDIQKKVLQMMDSGK